MMLKLHTVRLLYPRSNTLENLLKSRGLLLHIYPRITTSLNLLISAAKLRPIYHMLRATNGTLLLGKNLQMKTEGLCQLYTNTAIMFCRFGHPMPSNPNSHGRLICQMVERRNDFHRTRGFSFCH